MSGIDTYLNNLTFFNSFKNNMSFEDIVEYTLNFIRKDPNGIYTLAIGTDSQTKEDITIFISAIMIYKQGKGAWGCMSKYIHPRRISNLREKISIETYLTQQIASKFTPDILDDIINIIIPYIDKGSEFHHEVHIDVGKNGDTRKLINEMTSYFAGMDFEPKIKPYSFAASSYADRFTK